MKIRKYKNKNQQVKRFQGHGYEYWMSQIDEVKSIGDPNMLKIISAGVRNDSILTEDERDELRSEINCVFLNIVMA